MSPSSREEKLNNEELIINSVCLHCLCVVISGIAQQQQTFFKDERIQFQKQPVFIYMSSHGKKQHTDGGDRA